MTHARLLISAALLLLLPLNLMAQQAGDLDPTFGVGGKVLTDISGDNDEGQDVALQPDGGIIAAGYTANNVGAGGFALARYLPDGSLDTTFSGDGKLALNVGFGAVVDLVLQPDSRIVAIGSASLARFTADGALDTTFGAGGLVPIDFQQAAGVLQPDGKIVTTGSINLTSPFALARFLPDGSLDTTFGDGGRVNTWVGGGEGAATAVTLQPDGKIVVAGSSVSPFLNFTLARYLSDGTLDTTFGGDGVVTTDFGFGVVSWAYDVSLQADGKIVATGLGGLARYLSDGTLDTTFSDDGIVTDFGGNSLAIQPDGRLVVAGSFTTTGNEGGYDIALARYLAAPLADVGPPTSKEQCKQDGWRTFTIPRAFRNQGDCIRFVNTENVPAGTS